MPAYKSVSLSVEERSAKVETLLNTPEVVLKKLKLSELRDLAAGVVNYYKALPKVGLLEALLEIRTDELIQKEAIAQAARASEEARKELLASKPEEEKTIALRIKLYEKELTRIADTTTDSEARLAAGASYAATVMTQLMALHTDTTVKTYLTDIRRALDPENEQERPLQQVKHIFVRTLFSAFRDRMIAIKDDDRTKVKAKMSNNPVVNATALIAHAIETLENLKKGVNTKYTDVALALIMLTGRRPIEVLSCGHFEPDPTDNRKVFFSGQAKGKHTTVDKKDKVFLVPVLADSDLVIFAKQWLEAHCERIEDSTVFNNKYSKPLNRAMPIWRSVGEQENLTPKSLRAVYANYCADHFNTGSVNSRAVYLASIMGHEPNDPETFQSYQCYQVI